METGNKFLPHGRRKPRPHPWEKVTHGAKGIAFVNEREAELLTQSQELMSDYELAALVIGSHIQNPGRFSIKDIETPCRNKDNDRILVKAQLLNLGAKKISLQDEGSILTVDEIDAVVIACEAINEEMDEWDTFQEGPIKYLKKHIPSLEQGIIGTWARRFFLKNKQTSDAKGAQSCYFLMRVKRELVETVLKVVIPGMYFSPRNETGALDPDFKVIWFNDLPLQETILKANMEPQAFGVVRNKGGHGIRVKSQDFMKLKQKWQPAWKPMENAPYNLQIKKLLRVAKYATVLHQGRGTKVPEPDHLGGPGTETGEAKDLAGWCSQAAGKTGTFGIPWYCLDC